MKTALKMLLIIALTTTAHAAGPSQNFTGKWSFDPAQSKNAGMMAGGKITTRVTQTGTATVVDDTSVFQGQTQTQHTLYDLTGKATANISLMAGQATTRSHWDGAHLVTDWESPGAIAGTVVKRTETRYLSPDRNTMYVESARPNKEPVILVFVRVG